MPDLLLAIDTSTSWAGVALYDGQVRLELSWRAGRNHSQQMLPAIERALELTGATKSDLAAVAVARGPGSFTGVRVGITLARSLGFALSIPVLGVDSLDVLAHGQSRRDLPIRPLLEAGRGRYATALYRPDGKGLTRVTALQSIQDQGLTGLLTERTLLCGDLSSRARDIIRAEAGSRAVLPPPSGMVRRSAVLAELAWAGWKTGSISVAETDPIYITAEST